MKNFLQLLGLSLLLITFGACERESLDKECRPAVIYRNNVISDAYAYDNQNRLTRWDLYNSDGELITTWEYSYLEGHEDKLKERIVKDEDGIMYFKNTYSYSALFDTIFINNESIVNGVGVLTSKSTYFLDLSSPCLVTRYQYESLSDSSQNYQLVYNYMDENCSSESQRIDANGNMVKRYTRINSSLKNYLLNGYYYPFKQQYPKALSFYERTDENGNIESSYNDIQTPNKWNYPEESKRVYSPTDTVYYYYDYFCK